MSGPFVAYDAEIERSASAGARAWGPRGSVLMPPQATPLFASAPDGRPMSRPAAAFNGVTVPRSREWGRRGGR